MRQHYKESQPFYLILCILIPAAIVVLVCTFSSYGTTSLPYGVGIPLAAILLLLCLAFYKMTITITGQVVTVTFGTGVFKNKIPIKYLDIATASIVKLPWYWGVGLRLTPKGTLYSTTTGKGCI